MALLNCNNLGCMKVTEALLDLKTMEVICTECHRPITNISEAMKRSLKSFGQVVRDNTKKAFMMACKNCNANREVVLNEKDETVCNICKHPIKVHQAMKQALLALGKKSKEE